MSDYRKSVHKLLAEGYALQHGATQISLFEEAVRLADTHGDADLAYAARMELMDAANFGGRPDLLLVAFSWCLAHHDRNPERCAEIDGDEGDFGLLWEYKWVVASAVDFPQIPRNQIEELLNDMERRFQRANSTLHAVHHLRRDVSQTMGDRAGAIEADQRLAACARDWLSDCPACVLDSSADHAAFLGDYQCAVAQAESLIAGRMRCAEVPHYTHSNVLIPLLRLGRVEDAMQHHRKGYRLISTNPEFVKLVGDHVILLAATDNMTRAGNLLQKHLPDAMQTPCPGRLFHFYLGAAFFLDLVSKKKDTLKLRLPAAFSLHDPAGRYQTAELAGWFRGQTNDLAGRFDARNGNSYYRNQIEKLEELKLMGRPCPYRLPRQSEVDEI